MGYVRELDDVLWGRRSLGMWMQDKAVPELGVDWSYLLERFGINYEELRYHGQEGGAWSLGKDLQGRPLKVVCRYAYGESVGIEDGERVGITLEWIVGKPAQVDEHLTNWYEALECDITSKEYQVRTGLLLGYDEEGTKDFAERNKAGMVCSCTQCIPTTAIGEWWSQLELKEVSNERP